MVQRAIDAALVSDSFADIVLSTEDERIIESCAEFQDLRVDHRPVNLASDTATVLEVVLELMHRIEQEGGEFDTVTIMLPTCPFRRGEHIRDGLAMLGKDIDSVISVTEYDFPWDMSLLMDEAGDMHPAVEISPLVTGNTRSQDRRRVYHPNGAFYIGRWESIRRDGNFFRGKMKGYAMDNEYSADIDEPFDFRVAELRLQEGLA